jgi:hypothetical protein
MPGSVLSNLRLQVKYFFSEVLGTRSVSKFGMFFRFWNICIYTMWYQRDRNHV